MSGQRDTLDPKSVARLQRSGILLERTVAVRQSRDDFDLQVRGTSLEQRAHQRRRAKRACAQIGSVVQAQDQDLHRPRVQSTRVTSGSAPSRATIQALPAWTPNCGCQVLAAVTACW